MSNKQNKIKELKELKNEIVNYGYDSSNDSNKKEDIVEYFFNSVLKKADKTVDAVKKM